MKAIFVVDEMPTECIECPFHRIYADGFLNETYCSLMAKRNKDGVNTRAEWCPLMHPLKYVSNDFYIYDRKYLMGNLEREIDLLKETKAFEENMEKRNESNTSD